MGGFSDQSPKIYLPCTDNSGSYQRKYFTQRLNLEKEKYGMQIRIDVRHKRNSQNDGKGKSQNDGCIIDLENNLVQRLEQDGGLGKGV